MNNSNKFQRQDPSSSQTVSTENQMTHLTLNHHQSVQPTIVSDNFMKLRKEFIMRILKFVDFKTILAFKTVCKRLTDGCLDDLLISHIVSEDFPGRAISGFIANVKTCRPLSHFRRSVKLLIPNLAVPEDLSIHMFASSNQKQIPLDTVYSMIIQLHFPAKNHLVVMEFLKFVLKKIYFPSLEHLMLIGVSLDYQLASLLEDLNLGLLYLKPSIEKNTHQDPSNEKPVFDFSKMDKLKQLYIIHPNKDGYLVCPEKLERVVVYCSESSESSIESENNAQSKGFHLKLKSYDSLKWM